jgi:hypothetical protein
MTGIAPDRLLALWERGRGRTPAEGAAALLGAVTDAGTDLDVGSRDVLLARLLAATAGPLVWARAVCSSCGAALDVPVDVAAVAALPVHAPGEGLTVEVDGTPVRFRLPTTGDLLALRNVAPEVARDRLLRRCLGLPDSAGPVPEAVAAAVDAAMETAAPAGAIDLVVACPDCATTTAAALDVPLLLWPEVEARATVLIEQVHALAAAYGWTEPDVLALSPRRRAAYLELVGS